MDKDTDRLIVITGGPGSGKTTLIRALAEQGLTSAPEAGRAIIRHQVAIGGPALPWADRALFAELMLSWDMRSHEEALLTGRTVMLDRGAPDIAGYLALCGLPVPAHVVRAAERLTYRREVFIAPPWAEIYEQDAERKQDFAEAQRVFEAVGAAYRRFGYLLVELPRAPVAERAAFVLARLGLSPPSPPPG